MPEFVIETPGGEEISFREKTALSYRVFRFIYQICISILRLQLLFVITRISYMLGYINETLFPTREKEKIN